MDLGDRNSKSGDLASFTPPVSGMLGIRALVLVGGMPDVERFGGFPLALLDVLGRSVLLRTLDRIRAAGIGEIAVLSETDPLLPFPETDSCKFGVTSAECFWNEAIHLFRKLSWQSECVLMFRLGAWAEVDIAAMVREHRRSGAAITRARSQRGEALDVFAISSGSQSEAAALLRGALCDDDMGIGVHETDGYVNLLTTPANLRILTLDAFAGECEIRPCGRELRPGVWIGGGARVHRHARIVAPVFIGSFCKVHRAVIITRGSSLEHHSEVDCATVIDNSSVMPHTRVGAGLDVEYSVVGFDLVHSMPRNATVEIKDPLLIRATTNHFSFTAVSSIFSFLPNVLWKLFFESRPEPVLGTAPDAIANPTLSNPSLTPDQSQTDSYGEMAATRRYGNE